MATISITQSDNSGNSYSGEGVELFEFIPFVELRNTTGYNIEKDKLDLTKDENNQHVSVDLLTQTDNDQRNELITYLKTELKKPVIPFTVKKGTSNKYWFDDDGYIEVELSKEIDNYVKVDGVTAKIKKKTDKVEFDDSLTHKIFTTFDSEIEVEVSIESQETTEFYLRFFANDDDEIFGKGKYENLFCGCFKIEYQVKNSEVYFYSTSNGEYLGSIGSEFKNNRTILIDDAKYKELSSLKVLSLKNEKNKIDENIKFDWTNINQGGLPSLGELIHNYPTNKNNVKVEPSSDSYANYQCAIRLSYGLINSNFSLLSYPNVNKTSEGYGRSSKGIADWLSQRAFSPRIFLDSQKFDYLNAHGIVFLWDKKGVSHIDVIYYGQTGSGYYSADEIWYWELK